MEERRSALEETQGGVEGSGGLMEVIRSGPEAWGGAQCFERALQAEGTGIEWRRRSSRHRPGLDREILCFPIKEHGHSIWAVGRSEACKQESSLIRFACYEGHPGSPVGAWSLDICTWTLNSPLNFKVLTWRCKILSLACKPPSPSGAGVGGHLSKQIFLCSKPGHSFH